MKDRAGEGWMEYRMVWRVEDWAGGWVVEARVEYQTVCQGEYRTGGWPEVSVVR
ncbi:hypothetical protein L0665_02680 [Methanogenium marinum]|uniref:Uncharacterized protein n=1 Tax=Methanogenium marinum TaxID=348610 RepID=A0A9Q4PVF8_9EURY|nr:hypothetical protein [Methanogenium marinum]MDE4907524.1 hypothetical protein [Methanogenium marinum]